MLEAHRVASKYVQKENSGNMPAHHVLTQRPLDTSRAGAWKKVLSSEHTKMIEQVAGKQMATLGYELSRSREYQPPRMRAVYFSTRWIAAEGRRIADKQARTPYWALQRMMEPRPSEPSPAPLSTISIDAKPTPKRVSVGLRPRKESDQIRRSGT
jgi:hypothetical protein